MNSQQNSYSRRRGRTLLIVEGNHEKNELFRIILKAFPELSIQIEDVWIYGTNIYQLYDYIVKEYGEDWYESDIDLPLLISNRQGIEKCYKEDFTNIFLVFDYERHDPGFSVDKIRNMQAYFSDATDFGQLYINYPMIESYQDVDSFDVNDYIDRKENVSLQQGKEYKAKVRHSFMDAAIIHPVRIHDMLISRFHAIDNPQLENIVSLILSSSEEMYFIENTMSFLEGILSEQDIKTAAYQLKDHVLRIGYTRNGKNYWEHMRSIFQQLILINIEKAFRVQYGKEVWSCCGLSEKEKYDAIRFIDILGNQNAVSSHEGFIWVLSTCIMLVADYNFGLVQE